MRNNKTIGQMIGNPHTYDAIGDTVLPIPELLMGFEWEVEGFKGQEMKSKNLVIIGDDTLRNNGAEIIFSRPLCGQTLEKTVREFYRDIKWSTLENSSLCSSHCHLDMRWATVRQAQQCALLLAVHDEYLFDKYDSADRKENVYSVSCFNNATFYNDLKNIPRGLDRKYMSINLCNLGRGKGTIELRHFNVMDSAEKVINAISDIQNIIKPVFDKRDEEIPKMVFLNMIKNASLPRKYNHVKENVFEIAKSKGFL